MADTPVADAPTIPAEQEVDPFGYWPNLTSRISGLGGPEEGPDPAYVFHSSYVACRPGLNLTRVGFAKLKVMAGIVAIRVFRYRPDAGHAIDEIRAATVRLNALADANRPALVVFEAQADALYAVVCYALGDCEASAAGCTVTITHDPAGEHDPERRRSHVGRRTARLAPDLQNRRAPSLAYPVSQGFDRDQLSARDAQPLLAGIPAGLPAEERWEIAYIARVLSVYGRLAEGARGMAVAPGDDAVVALVNRAPVSLHVVTVPETSALPTTLGATADLPGAETLDFLWARSGLLSDTPELAGDIDYLLGFLKPAGLAIVMVGLLLTDDTGRDAATRNRLNRLVLNLVGDGHIVAQLRFPPAPEADRLTPFGLVIRKKLDTFG